jgi:ABC-type antimicrobial peptide transport system permease subunit
LLSNNLQIFNMPFLDIIRLALRNLREAKLRVALTTTGIIVGVAVIVTMVSFGLGLQQNAMEQFKDVDSFHEIHVYGRTLFSLADGEQTPKPAGDGQAVSQDDTELRYGKPPKRSLDDKALAEMKEIPGVSFVKPYIFFVAFARSNNRSLRQSFSGAMVPDPTARFKELATGRMFSSPDAAEAVVTPEFVHAFGYNRSSDVMGQTLELLEPVAEGRSDDQKGRGVSESADASGVVAAHTYRIVGVLKDESGGNRFNGMMPTASVYLPLPMARIWKDEHLDAQSKIALALARKKGTLNEQDSLSYTTAVIRVANPIELDAVRRRISELGFGSFSFIDEFNQARVLFLIINSALGLLGGISLLVASFGIANTMLMSILERTREIGIMKAIGAEDSEIKLIFFVEASILGLTGGVVGALLAWGIDFVANHLAYRFLLQPHGAAYVNFFALPPYLWMGALGLAVLVSIVAALYPASRAVRVDPVTALRHD